MLGAGPALADSPAAGLQVMPTDWSGAYVGVQGGGGLAFTGWTFPVDSFFTLFDGNKSFNAAGSGGVMGGHVTLNHQIGSLVIGAELLVSASQVERERIGPITAVFPNDRITTRLADYGTLTARLGYAHDDLLLYASGGYAAGHVSVVAVSAAPVAGVIGQAKQRLDGWTVGGGLEWMFAPSIVLGLQYDFIRLNGETTATTTTGTPDDTPFVIHNDDVELHAVTARLSLKLDWLAPASPAN
jgi:outer membrane immunogenic protein